MIKVTLTNSADKHFSLSNEFMDVVMLKAELQCCNIQNEKDIEKILNKYSTHAEWIFRFRTPNSVIFKAYDAWNNLHYLIVEEVKEGKKRGKK